MIASRDGPKLYATVGSKSNVAENGLSIEEGRAAIWEVDPTSGSRRLYASGLDRRGALLVADDLGNVIGRVTAAGAK